MPLHGEPSRLAWLANRLRVMSLAEMAHRASHVALSLVRRPRLPNLANLLDIQSVQPWFGVNGLPSGLDIVPYLAEADEILEGKVRLFAKHVVDVGAEPDWNRNPVRPGETEIGRAHV